MASSNLFPPHLIWPAQFCAFVTFETWIHSLITSNVSQVDRLWTLLPTIYSGYYALLPLFPNEQSFWLAPYAPKELGFQAVFDYSPRALLMLSLIIIWMWRLSYNTWRRGLFSPQSEDYRWVVLRQKLPPLLFQLTNFFFIAFTQNVLLLLLSLPTYTAAVLQPHDSLATSDYLLALAALVILAFEFTADNQQYAFHAYKHAYFAKQKGETVKAYDPRVQWPGARLEWHSEDAKRGFCTRGLWAYARHPNFTCEQAFWVVITTFPLVAPASPNLMRSFPLSAFFDPSKRAEIVHYLQTDFALFCWHCLPAAALCLLFWASTMFTESITARKYPAYKAYQKRVGFRPVDTLWKRLSILLFGGGQKELDELDRVLWKKVD